MRTTDFGAVARKPHVQFCGLRSIQRLNDRVDVPIPKGASCVRQLERMGDALLVGQGAGGVFILGHASALSQMVGATRNFMSKSYAICSTVAIGSLTAHKAIVFRAAARCECSNLRG